MNSHDQTVITRFAPSPTGFLHIGGARTALFNWLYARARGGKFLLRIEDTDRKRSTDAATEAIYDGLKWLGLDWDGDAISQFSRAERHKEVADQLVRDGHAYPCYCSPEELAEMREKARADKRPMRYDRRWRDRDPADAPTDQAPAIRVKMPLEGTTTIEDQVQGTVTVPNSDLDDMIILRADGTPTYMLSVVVDDHDMGVTHVIRGDDHLTNTFRQVQIFKAMGWSLPHFSHVPLIHGPDGAKLSKRHGALGVDAYRDMGYLPSALRNYLLRLGWGHGDEEIISNEQALDWFDLPDVGRSPARFDFAKLENLNGHYLRTSEDDTLAELARPFVESAAGKVLDNADMALLERALPGLKERAKTLVELGENAAFYFRMRPLEFTEKAKKLLSDDAQKILAQLLEAIGSINWTEQEIEQAVRDFSEQNDLKLGKVAQPLRAALTGSTMSPGIFEVLAILGRDESLARIRDQALNAKI